MWEIKERTVVGYRKYVARRKSRPTGYCPAPFDNGSGGSSTSAINWVQDPVSGHFCCTLSNGMKIYLINGANYYLGPTNTWVPYSGLMI